MKKTLLAASLLCAATFSHAGDPNGTMAIQASGKKVISNGFYLHLGVAFPSMKTKSFEGTSVDDADKQSLGVQPSIEIGNQWYFVKKENFGFGMRVSWLQFGYSAGKIKFDGQNVGKSGNVDLRFIKIAPQATFGINDDMGIDVSVEVAPTFIISGYKYDNSSETGTQAVGGVLFAPGARFRYKKFAAGFDVSLGTLSGGTTLTDGGDTYDTKVSVMSPRVYVGFKF